MLSSTFVSRDEHRYIIEATNQDKPPPLGAEMSVSTVCCLTKSETNRKPAESKSIANESESNTTMTKLTEYSLLYETLREAVRGITSNSNFP